MTYDFVEGDIAECPNCGKEFKMDNLDEDDYNDFDIFFEHTSMCEG